MQTIEDLRRLISVASDMQSVVAMMKTMAAVSIRQYDAAADAMAEYDRAITLGLHVLLRDQHELRPRRFTGVESVGRIVIGSDQGLCGQFNDDIVRLTLSDVQQDRNVDAGRTIAVGARAVNRLSDASIAIEHRFRVPATAGEITTLLQDLMPHIDMWQNSEIERIVVYFNRRTSDATYVPDKLQLLPLPNEFLERCRSMKWESRSLPMLGMEWDDLFAATIRQYLFSGLFRSCAESRASENASRIAAMQSAEKNIDRRLTELQSCFNASRQAAITEELLDVVTGFEALTKTSRKKV